MVAESIVRVEAEQAGQISSGGPRRLERRWSTSGTGQNESEAERDRVAGERDHTSNARAAREARWRRQDVKCASGIDAARITRTYPPRARQTHDIGGRSEPGARSTGSADALRGARSGSRVRHQKDRPSAHEGSLDGTARSPEEGRRVRRTRPSLNAARRSGGGSSAGTARGRWETPPGELERYAARSERCGTARAARGKPRPAPQFGWAGSSWRPRASSRRRERELDTTRNDLEPSDARGRSDQAHQTLTSKHQGTAQNELEARVRPADTPRWTRRPVPSVRATAVASGCSWRFAHGCGRSLTEVRQP